MPAAGNQKEVTRGFGVLESLLAAWRTRVANRFIDDKMRQGRVLDIGCGAFPYFLAHTSFAEKYGLDQTPGPLWDNELFQSKKIRLTTFVFDGTQPLPFPDRFFDVVTMLAVIEHISPSLVVAYLREIERVLKPGGLFFVTTPHAWTLGLLKGLAFLRLVSPVEIEDHKFLYTPAALRAVVAAAGFPAGGIQSGFFQAGINIWMTARKN